MSNKTPEEGRYSKVSRRIWNDKKFRELSQPKPNAQTLWMRLLTGPELGIIPGLFAAREGGLADALDWPIAAFRKCWKEIESEKMAHADWRSGVVWVPNSIRHNEPGSPNTVASWRKAANELPECPLRAKAFEALAQYLIGMGPIWIGAWNLALGSASQPAKIGSEVRVFVRERDGDNCRYCGTVANWNDRKGPTGATYDHVDPTGPATVVNIVVACRSCNSKKGFKTPEMAGMALIQIGSRSESRSANDSDLDAIKHPSAIQDQEQDLRSQITTKSQDLEADRANDVVVVEIPELQRKYLSAQKNPGTFALAGGVNWPEFRAIWDAWCKPFGISGPPVVTQRIDQDILAIIDAFAAGYTLDQLLAAGQAAETSSFIASLREQRKGGPSSFSPKVIRQLLAEQSPSVAKTAGDLGEYGKASDWS